MMFADLPLARRLERAAMAIEAGYATAHAGLNAGGDFEVLRVADGLAIFAGIGSPMSQATGLGLESAVSEADLDALEACYFRRNAAARIVVCPLVDEAFVSLLNRRGYRPSEFENSMIRELGGDEEPAKVDPRIEVRLASSGEANLYADVVGPSFTGDGVLPPELREMMHALFLVPEALAFLACFDGEPAGGGALLPHGGVGMLAGAATRPEFRNRGIQTALFHARLRAATDQGCDLAVMGARPGSGSQRNAERKGFRVAYTKVVVTRDPV